MSLQNIIETDVLVIGGGQAGGFAAIKAKEQGVDVTLVDKGYVGKSGQTTNCNYFLVFDPKHHDLNAWIKWNHAKSEYMDNQEWVEIIFKESLARWQDLCSWGLEVFKWNRLDEVFISSALENDGDIVTMPYREPLEKKEEGKNKEEDARSIANPCSSKRFPTRKLSELLRNQAVKTGVRIVDRITITDLLKQDGRIVGAVGISADSYDLYVFKAKAVVMCAGAAGLKADGIRTFVTTGDADAMAYRAGCEITGKEWNCPQPVRADFPTWPWSALDRDRFRSYRDPEAKFEHSGGGCPKYNAEGHYVGTFPTDMGWCWDMDEAWEAHKGRAPMFFEVTSASPEFLIMNRSPKGLPRQNIDEKASLRGRVRMVYGRALGQSFHLADGIWPIDTSCATQVPGLYAAGDCLGARPGYASGGYAMTQCAVTGARAGVAAAEYASQAEKPAIDKKELERLEKIAFEPMERKGGFTPGWVTQILKHTMWPYWILYIKKADRLQAALTQIEFMRDNIVPKLMAKDPHELRQAHEVKSMMLNAEMKLQASLYRTESRLSHFREDYPRRDDPAWLVWVKIKEENGGMKLSKEPIPEKWWPDLSLPYGKRYPILLPGDGRK